MKGRIQLAWFVSSALLCALDVRAAPISQASPARHIIVIDTSFSMVRRKQAITDALSNVISSGLNGHIRDGETVAIWTFNETVDSSSLPPFQWRRNEARALANSVVEFLSKRWFRKQTRMTALVSALSAELRKADQLTVVLLSDGDADIAGTPFDRSLNLAYRDHRKSVRRARRIFVTILRARAGAFQSWTLNQSGDSIRVPELPEPPREELLESLASRSQTNSVPVANRDPLLKVGADTENRFSKEPEEPGGEPLIVRDDEENSAPASERVSLLPPSVEMPSRGTTNVSVEGESKTSETAPVLLNSDPEDSNRSLPDGQVTQEHQPMPSERSTFEPPPKQEDRSDSKDAAQKVPSIDRSADLEFKEAQIGIAQKPMLLARRVQPENQPENDLQTSEKTRVRPKEQAALADGQMEIRHDGVPTEKTPLPIVGQTTPGAGLASAWYLALGIGLLLASGMLLFGSFRGSGTRGRSSIISRSMDRTKD